MNSLLCAINPLFRLRAESSLIRLKVLIILATRRPRRSLEKTNPLFFPLLPANSARRHPPDGRPSNASGGADRAADLIPRPG